MLSCCWLLGPAGQRSAVLHRLPTSILLSIDANRAPAHLCEQSLCLLSSLPLLPILAGDEEAPCAQRQARLVPLQPPRCDSVGREALGLATSKAMHGIA